MRSWADITVQLHDLFGRPGQPDARAPSIGPPGMFLEPPISAPDPDLIAQVADGDAWAALRSDARAQFHATFASWVEAMARRGIYVARAIVFEDSACTEAVLARRVGLEPKVDEPPQSAILWIGWTPWLHRLARKSIRLWHRAIAVGGLGSAIFRTR